MTLPTTFNLPIDRVLIGSPAKWNAEAKWVDRDGLPIPSTPKLVLGMRKIVRRWLDKKPIDIVEHPLARCRRAQRGDPEAVADWSQRSRRASVRGVLRRAFL